MKIPSNGIWVAFWVSVFMLIPGSIMKAQVYTMTNGQTINVCSGTLLDPGGSTNYANNANVNYTLCSSSAGQCLQLSFGAFALESGWDFLSIYDGNSAASALIGTFSGGVLPPVITSTGGCLFFVFTSDGSITLAGWSATITCVACPPPPSVPVNDLICNATPITCGQTLNGSTVLATDIGTGEGLACGTSQTEPGVWYSFAGNGQSVTASLCGSVWDSRISIFSGSCNAPTCLGGIDDGGPACGGTAASYNWIADLGVNYYILVSGFSTNSAFSLSLNCAAPPECITCANATPIPAIPFSGTYTTCGACNSVTSGQGCVSPYLGGEDYLFTYTPAVSGAVTISLTGTLTWTGVFVTQGCPTSGGGCLASNTSAGGNPTINGLILTSGIQYYIIVDTYPAPDCTPFGISIQPTTTPPGPIVASDCSIAVNVCTNTSFQIDPNGSGNVVEFGTNSVSNPSINPASTNSGCLLSGELNSTWMIVNIATSGTLEFLFGAPQLFGGGCLDWIMWPYSGPNTCTQIINNQLSPIRCNWNSPCQNYTGIATPVPSNGASGNFEPELNVTCGEQYLICLSNYSSQITSIPLVFTGTASISCTTFTPIAVNSATICVGASATLTATGGNTYSWSPATGLSATSGATVTASPPSTTTYTVYGNGPCGDGTATSTVTVNPNTTTTFNPISPICSGDALSLPTTSTNGISGTWSPAVNNTATTTYTFTPAPGSCASTVIITVTVNPDPSAFASAPIVPTCTGSTVTLQAQTVPGATYSWTGPGGYTSNAQNPVLTNVTLANEGVYTLTVTLNGCSQTATALLNIDQPSPYSVNYNGPYCGTDGFATVQNSWIGEGTYSATPAGLSIDAETGDIDPAASTPGTYTVTYTPLGCGAPVSVVVEIYPPIETDGISHD